MERKPHSRVELTQRALAELREIEQFSIQEWGHQAARKYIDGIAAALDRLQETPEILRLEPDFASGLYFFSSQKAFLGL